MIYSLCKRFLDKQKQRFDKRFKQDIKNASLIMMIRRGLGQPLQNQTDLFVKAQSFYDDAAEFCQLINSIIDKIIQPVFEFFVQFTTNTQLRVYKETAIVYASLPIVAFVLIKLQRI